MAFVLATIVLAIVAVEAGFRGIVALRTGPRALLYGTGRDPLARHTVARHDALRRGYSKYAPGSALTDFDPLTGATFPVHINAQGFRGRDFPAKAPGALRVVTLGASSTFGYHARDDATWPRRLEERLRTADPSRAWEVLNLGVPHLMSEEIAALFAAEALPLDPDVVTFYEGINDASLRRERHHVRRSLRRVAPLRSAWRLVRDHLLLAKLADDLVRPRARRYDEAEVLAHAEGRAGLFVSHLEAIRGECARRGIAFVVATQQATSLSRPREELRGLAYAAEEAELRARLARGETVDAAGLAFLTHTGLMRALRAWAGPRDVPLVDVIAALDDRRDTLVSWVHLTPEGNDRVAEAFAPVILSIAGP